MQLINVRQGSPEWLALRREHFTASEAVAMMGDSPFKTRDRLLHEKATGSTEEVTPQQQQRFDDGHAAEALARPLIEEQEMKQLFPVTGTRDVDGLPLLASFDGLDLDRTLIFEHKLWNKKVAAQIEGDCLEPAYYWQLEHQLLVTGQDNVRVIFVCSDGTRDKLRWVYYQTRDDRRQALIAGWHQFKEDLDNYQPQPAPAQPLVGEVIQDTTALAVQINGSVSSSNLHLLEEQVHHCLNSIKSALVTDQDFVNAKAAVKFLKTTEQKLKDGKEAALAQVPDIFRLFAAIDRLTKDVKNKYKLLADQIKDQDRHIKDSIVLQAVTSLEKERQALNVELTPGWVPSVISPAGFQEVIKGKRNISSMQSAVNDRLAQARIEQKQQAKAVRNNLAVYQKMAADKDYLFPDLDTLLHKDPMDLMAIIDMRLNQEARQTQPANEPAAPVPTAKPDITEDQQDLLYTDGEVTEEVLTDDIHAMEKWLGKGSLDCYRFGKNGNEYGVELVIRRTGIISSTDQLTLKEA